VPSDGRGRDAEGTVPLLLWSGLGAVVEPRGKDPAGRVNAGADVGPDADADVDPGTADSLVALEPELLELELALTLTLRDGNRDVPGVRIRGRSACAGGSAVAGMVRGSRRGSRCCHRVGMLRVGDRQWMHNAQ
jgi:hypothetical protein